MPPQDHTGAPTAAPAPEEPATPPPATAVQTGTTAAPQDRRPAANGTPPGTPTATGSATTPRTDPTGSGRPRRIPLPALAGGTQGPRLLRPLIDTVLDALGEGAAHRAGPLPPGGPKAVARELRAATEPLLPDVGQGAHEALNTLVRALAAGAADPADPYCAAHLHCPPLAVAVAADLAAAALNPSLDSWDQAPAASVLESRLTAELARLVYPGRPAPDALVTTGGTESNQLALLLARERARAAGSPALHTLCGANSHHSIHRAAWLLGLPQPLTLPTPHGTLDPAALDRALDGLRGPVLVVATAGTTDSGAIDPLPQLARTAEAHGAELHIDAAYAGPLLLSPRRRHLLTGLEAAHSVSIDLHKLGWQPIAAGLLAVPDAGALRPLHHSADYLSAPDDTEAGLPELLGRSLRTSRRPDILKIAVTLRALGRQGLAALVDRVCDQAAHLAALIDAHPRLTLHSRPIISTVLFRPTDATDAQVAALRRSLLAGGTAVFGRAQAPDAQGTPRLWLKATLLNPTTRPHHLAALVRYAAEPPVATAPAGPATPHPPASEGASTR